MIKSLGLIAGSQIFGLLFGLLRVKIIALVLGPSGIALFGLIQNIGATASNLFLFGTSGVLLKNMRHYKVGSVIESTIISVQFYVGLTWMALFCLTQVSFLKEKFFPDFSDFLLWFFLIFIGLLSGLNAYRTALISLLETNKKFAINLFVNALLMSGLMSLLIIWKPSNDSLLYAYLIAQVLFILSFPLYLRRWLLVFTWQPTLRQARRILASRTFKMSAYLLIVGFGPLLIMLNLRYRYIEVLGPEMFGRVSAVWTLYLILEGLLIQYLGATYLKSVGNSKLSITTQFKKFYYFLFPLIVFAVSLSLLLNDFLVLTIFSRDFFTDIATVHNFVSLLFLKCYAHMLASALLKNVNTKIFFILELTYFLVALFVINLFYDLLPFLDILLILQALYAVFVGILLKTKTNLRFPTEFVLSLCFSLLGALYL